MANAESFIAVRLLGIGCFSLVFSVISKNQQDQGSVYALKRYFIRRPRALFFALKEFNILKRLADLGNVSPFLPKLFYSFRIGSSPVLVLNRESQITLNELIGIVANFTEKEIKFYLAEIMSALRYLHSLNIVHMDLKPGNILMTIRGHIMLSDFDRSFDFTAAAGAPKADDFLTTSFYAAPEIARKQVISEKADVWSLGVIACELNRDPHRIDTHSREKRQRLSKKGYWQLTCYDTISPEFKEFLHACLTVPYVLRPSILRLQNFAFFRDIQWHAIQALEVRPPYTSWNIQIITEVSDMRRSYQPEDHAILDLFKDRGSPVVHGGNFEYRMSSGGTQEIAKRYMTTEFFERKGYSREMITDIYKKFNYINPSLLASESQSAETGLADAGA